MRFEFLVDDIFLLKFFHMHWRIHIIPKDLRIEIWDLSKCTFLLKSLGHKKIWELRFEILLIVWLVVSSYEECSFFWSNRKYNYLKIENCQNPNLNSTQPQDNLNWCWVWYEYDFTTTPPPLPTTTRTLLWQRESKQCSIN